MIEKHFMSANFCKKREFHPVITVIALQPTEKAAGALDTTGHVHITYIIYLLFFHYLLHRYSMKVLNCIVALLFCCVAAGICTAAAAEGQHPATIEMKGESAPPALVVLQQDKDGGNQILEDVPEKYPAVIPYFLDYIQNGIEESGGDLQEKEASAIAITYGYPDNLEINILSEEREKIVRKIKPDEKLHKLRIRSAMLMINFIKDETGNVSSNAVPASLAGR